jgi:hypothetical protein
MFAAGGLRLSTKLETFVVASVMLNAIYGSWLPHLT